MRTLEPFTRHLFNNLNSLLEENLTTQLPLTPDAHQLFTTESGWVVRVDLPGFDKSEIELHYEDKALHLKAERADDAPFSRPAEGHRFPLGEEEVDVTAISAKLEHGVLEIALPKKQETPVTKLQIEIQ